MYAGAAVAAVILVVIALLVLGPRGGKGSTMFLTAPYADIGATYAKAVDSACRKYRVTSLDQLTGTVRRAAGAEITSIVQSHISGQGRLIVEADGAASTILSDLTLAEPEVDAHIPHFHLNFAISYTVKTSPGDGRLWFSVDAIDANHAPLFRAAAFSLERKSAPVGQKDVHKFRFTNAERAQAVAGFRITVQQQP
jgi:hypothetical protein